MTDRVLEDEARYDRDCTAQEVLMEQGRAFAQTAYEAGELADWIEDEASPYDTCHIALHVLDWLDEFEDSMFGSFEESVDALIQNMPVLCVRDFRATRDHVVELKAKMIAEDL